MNFITRGRTLSAAVALMIYGHMLYLRAENPTWAQAWGILSVVYGAYLLGLWYDAEHNGGENPEIPEEEAVQVTNNVIQ